jgi:hypothetical protein
VTPAATTITWNTPAAIVYGTALSTRRLNATVDGGIAGRWSTRRSKACPQRRDARAVGDLHAGESRTTRRRRRRLADRDAGGDDDHLEHAGAIVYGTALSTRS